MQKKNVAKLKQSEPWAMFPHWYHFYSFRLLSIHQTASPHSSLHALQSLSTALLFLRSLPTALFFFWFYCTDHWAIQTWDLSLLTMWVSQFFWDNLILMFVQLILSRYLNMWQVSMWDKPNLVKNQNQFPTTEHVISSIAFLPSREALAYLKQILFHSSDRNSRCVPYT